MRAGERFDISSLMLPVKDSRRMKRLPSLIRHASRDTFSRKREKDGRRWS
jgi:hypothetical protein